MKITKNCMGTASFIAKFKGMRKEQDFIVYPVDHTKSAIKIQSDTRIGSIDLHTGIVELCPPVSSGAYNHHMYNAKPIDSLSADDLEQLKAFIRGTADKRAGTNGIIFVDNSQAALI